MKVQYDPALYLGCFIKKEHFKWLQDVSKLHHEIEAEKDCVDNMKKSLEEFEIMKYELGALEEKDAQEELDTMGKDIQKDLMDAQMNYIKTSNKNYKSIAKLAREKGQVSYGVESAIDWEKSALKSFPVSADTMKCDAKWFNYDSQNGSASQHAEEIGGHIKASLSKGMFSGGADIAYQSSKNQQEMNSTDQVLSTLVITCMCTHKNATTISPLVLDPEKLKNAWNTAFPDSGDGKPEEGSTLYMVSGASYASALVGTVTFKNESKKTSSLDENETKASFEANLGISAIFSANADGHKNTVDSVMNMLANQTVSVSINLYCAGCIINLEKQQLYSQVKLLEQLDTKHLGNKMTELLQALQQGKTTETSVLNATTLMNAFDNYLSLASAGDTSAFGVPINYFLRPITKQTIDGLEKEKEKGPPVNEEEEGTNIE